MIFFADRGDVAVLKTHVIKSPNLMGWLYWRFAAINVENRGIGHAWRMPVNLSPISDMPDIGDFIRRSQRSAKIAIAAPDTPGDFRFSRRSAYKIARCVAGLRPYANLAGILIFFVCIQIRLTSLVLEFKYHKDILP